MNEKEIRFFYEDTKFRLRQTSKIRNWVYQIIISRGYALEALNYIICSDAFLLEINKTHLNHNYLTDIITFPLSEDPGSIEADIYVSIDRIKDNASQLNQSLKDEIHRVLIHGVLHLMGQGDKTPEEKDRMRKKEDLCLSLRDF